MSNLAPRKRITGGFYALQREELIALKKAKLINNAAYIHFALRIENPFCDRPVEIIPKEFALRWQIPEVSVYKAVAKLKELNLIKIKSGKLVIDLIIKPDNQDASPELEAVVGDETAEKLSDPIIADGENYQNGKKIIKFDKKLSDPIIDYQIRKNRGLEPLQNIASDSLQSIQNFQTNQKGVKAQIKVEEEELNQSEQVKVENEVTQNESKKTKSKQSEKTTTEAIEKKKVPLRVARKKLKVEPDRRIAANKRVTKEEIPIDLVERLEELEIPLDEKVLNAISSHHISQAYGAAAHVENTWETINNPRGVFLFQLPKQKIEKLGPQLPEIGKQMREENEAIEEEMATDEYKAKSQEMFAKLREKLGKGGKKK